MNRTGPANTARMASLATLVPVALALGGCISLGGEPPESLLTLHALENSAADAGTVAGDEAAAGAIAVLTPETPAKLDVLRIPVAMSDTEIAYLQEAFWVEKPARLFRRLLGESLRKRTSALVIDSDDTPVIAVTTLRGTLLEMGYDAPSSSVMVRFEAIRTDAAGEVFARRFDARETGIAADAGAVGPALNRVANRVAQDIADWVAEAG